ncbi:MAG TPA: YraN family protein [Polyangiaceae bacterium]|jgi:putative endonuclease|nr:YraN family protein [Polyangiaceae bacterium]
MSSEANRRGAPGQNLRAERGARAEELVARWLGEQGYSIVATNLRVGRLEIDIVARLGTVIAVVEVRTRGAGAWTTPFGSVDGTKRARLRRAGERLWQRRYKHDSSVERLRFDVASVRFEDGVPSIEYAVAAF